MPALRIPRLKSFITPFVIGVFGPILLGQALAMNLGVRCQADPDSVFQAVRESAQAMPHWRSIRVVEGQRAVKAMVLNWRNYAVPVVIQVQSNLQDDSKDIVEVHVLWEQTMDPVNYPDLTLFMETFWETQELLKLNCVDHGTDVGL
jgi:hypothetical protein